MNSSATLDPDEYFHLACHANSVGDHHACLRYLKEVLQQQPQHLGATYLLAVQHAELGLVARAVAGLTATLDAEPKMDVARFQLGWIYLDSGRPAEAKKHFVMLSAATDESLRTFAQGLIALSDGHVVLAREKLALGLSQRATYPALSAMMQRLLERISASAAAPSPADPPPRAADEPVFLGAYGQKSR